MCAGAAAAGSTEVGGLGTHLLLDALQALTQLLPLPGEVLVAAPDVLDLLQDVVDTPAREGGRRHQGEVEEKVKHPAEPARAGRGPSGRTSRPSSECPRRRAETRYSGRQADSWRKCGRPGVGGGRGGKESGQES